jgi:rhodanese-related sulfurtransferase
MRWKQFLTPVKNIKVKEAQTFIDEHSEGTYTLLDVRQPAEYEKSRIPGSKLIPVVELVDRLGELDRGKPIIAY